MLISEDTVWREGSIVDLSEDVEVASGAKLTIEQGVTVNGGRIRVFGALDVLGSKENRVYFNDTYVGQRLPHGETTRSINGSFFTANGGGFYGDNLADAYFNGSDIGYGVVERSVFRNTWIGISPDKEINNNLFFLHPAARKATPRLSSMAALHLTSRS